MTLAVILSLCTFCAAPVRSWMQTAGQQAPPAHSSDSAAPAQNNTNDAQSSPPSQTPAPQAPATTPPSSTPAGVPAQKSSAQNSATGRPTRRKKAPPASTASDCTKSVPPAGNALQPESAAQQNAADAGKTPPTECPPPRTVVHNGGTTEPSIHLVGGAKQRAAVQRSTTDQLVGSTEENLKKIAERRLDANEQEMLKQIQQFLAQSKAALAAGDLERGQNLAVKAHLLSDELAKP